LPDIYLITFDALRAEETSVYGYRRTTTPNLERFSRYSFTFDYFFANSNLTTPATTSIETGELPWSHHVYQLGGFLRGQAQHETLAAVLRRRGYYTAMLSSNYWATPMQHKTIDGYDALQSADARNLTGMWIRCVSLLGLNTPHTLSGPLLKRLTTLRHALDFLIWSNTYPSPPEEAFERTRLLVEHSETTQPRFVWTHVMPPHDPYLPPLPYRTRFLASNKLTHVYDFLGFQNTKLPRGASETDVRARYDEMVLYGDHALGEFLDWLDKTGRLDRSLVIISSDHGESFEHNWYGHTGPKLYNGMIHIPLLIHLPGQHQSAHISQPAQQADLLPTIVDLVGEQAPAWADGRSLKPLFEGKVLPDRPVFSMNLERNGVFGRISTGTIAMMDGDFKYVSDLSSHKEDLYRYRVDEYEDHDLIASRPDVAKDMRESLLQKLKEVNQKHSP
jgi:arylsulfatase A-like enzyme